MLEADKYREEDILVMLNSLTAQRKIKQSVFEDEGRDELKQQEIERLVLIVSEEQTHPNSFITEVERRCERE